MDERQDVGSGVGAADADVMQAAGDARCDAAGGGDLLVPNAVAGVGGPDDAGRRYATFSGDLNRSTCRG